QRQAAGGLSSGELSSPHHLLLQWDRRWGYAPYGSSVIGLNGCGPTCLSMVITMLKGDGTTPDRVAAYSEDSGCYESGRGTTWQLMTEGAAHYGLTCRELPLWEATMKQELDAGHPIICSVGPGDFTTEGHYIVIYGYDGGGFLVNDPNSMARSGVSWDYDRLSGQIRNLWSFSL
ncbi:MAG: C39 family peptidase, partial [Oscillospiraceae bacterium]|nr:C39 family peptidase [Oscillospiraceae bacterium]